MIFVGDDWAEEHHDVYLMDEGGKRLTSRRLPEGLTGIRQLHELIASHVEEPDQVIIGIETDRGLWVGALSAAGYLEAHLRGWHMISPGLVISEGSAMPWPRLFWRRSWRARRPYRGM